MLKRGGAIRYNHKYAVCLHEEKKKRKYVVVVFLPVKLYLKIFYTVLSVLANILAVNTLHFYTKYFKVGCYVIYRDSENTPKIK